MPKVLFAWELGAGLGHIAPCRALFEILCARGHSVTLVLRDLSRAKSVFEGLKLAILQAPVKINLPSIPASFATSYAHILHNVGYEDATELEGLFDAWRTIYELEHPDLVIADHSPTALLALRGFPARKVTIGCGFLIPPDTYPLQSLRPSEAQDPVTVQADENRVCKMVNSVLENHGQPPLERLGNLFGDVDDTILTTYPELDHYAERPGGTGNPYWGVRKGFRGANFDWPAGDGPRVFVYLNYFPQLEPLLQILKDAKYPTIVCHHAFPAEVRQKYQTAQLRFEPPLLDIDKLTSECSFAILNGNHDTACYLLLAGKPILFLPDTLEKWMLSVVVQKLGAGLTVLPGRQAEFAPKLAHLDSCVPAAKRFAARYAGNDPSRIHELLADRIEEILKPDWVRAPMASPLRVNEVPQTPPIVEKASTPFVPSVKVNKKIDDSTQLLNAGLEHHRNGRLQEAAESYRLLLEREPENPNALNLLGAVQLQFGQFDKAVELIGRAATLAPTEASFHSNLGEAYRNLAQFDRAIECFLTALRLRPEYADACNNLALALQAQGKHKAAAARFREAIKYNPRYVAAYNNLGCLYGELGQDAEAQACFEKAREAQRK